MCSEDKVYLRVDYIMTLERTNKTSSDHEVLVALSDYRYIDYNTITDRVYTVLPNDSNSLKRTLCLNNRRGFLCENCIEGFGPAFHYSQCKNCTQNSLAKRIGLFLTLKLLPITVIFLLLMVFRFNVTHGPILGYVIFCQAHTMSAGFLMAFYQLILYELHSYRIILQISLFLSAFWGMDYSPLYGNFCISSSLNSLNIYYLNYISVFYPVCLILLTCIFIELHARNFRLIIFIWKPFHVCLSKFRRNLSTTDSIIHAYATLLFLSFGTLNYTTFQLLRLKDVYNKGGVFKTGVLYHRPSQQYNHYIINYLVVLTIMFCVGVLPILLLCIHSIKWCRSKINIYFSRRVQIAMNIFADTFQGTFKEKYRMFTSGIAFTIITATLLGTIGHTLIVYTVPIFIVILVISSLLIAYARPCRALSTDISLSFHMLWMAAVGQILSNYIIDVGSIKTKLAILMLVILPVPHIIMLLWVLHKILCQLGYTKVISSRLLKMKGKLFGEHESCENLLPDRIENSENYHEISNTAGHFINKN